MKYLLDTCVLSELVKSAPSEQVIEWFKQHQSDEMFISAISLAELLRGVAKMSESKRRNDLIIWIKQIESDFKDRILSFDHNAAHSWSDMIALAEVKGKSIAALDSLIAATAQTHECYLVTRNLRDFVYSGVNIINPWDNS